MTLEATAALEILQAQRMPLGEIRVVLAADDPLLIRRLLELHRERLREWLEEQRRLVAIIEQALVIERVAVPFGVGPSALLPPPAA